MVCLLTNYKLPVCKSEWQLFTNSFNRNNVFYSVLKYYSL